MSSHRPRRGVDGANFISRHLVAWATPIAWLGFQRPLKEIDLPGPPRFLCAVEDEHDVCNTGARLWAEEMAKARKENRPASLVAMWRKLAHVQWVIGGSLGFATGVLTSLARPYVLRELILALDGGSNERAYSLAVGFAIVCAFESWTRTASRYWAGDCAPLMCVSASIQLVANKAMMLRVGAGKEGAETSLVGNDLFRLADMLAVAGVGLTGVASIISGTAMLLLWLGPIVRRRRRRRSKAFYPARFCLPPAPSPCASPTPPVAPSTSLASPSLSLAWR